MKSGKILLPVLLALFAAASLHAQVTFVVTNLPANTPAGDYLYIAGNFTGWNPGAAEYRMQKNEQQQWSITLPAQAEGTVYQFKFTRGSWETVEKGAGGEEIANRNFVFGNGSTQEVSILRWADDGGGASSTAAANVSVMDENFYMPQLNRSRTIRIFLPPGYETSGLNYPVFYMHDGQNLFDVLTAYAGEWEVDETLNRLASLGHQVPIVVGIDNGGAHRIAEYTPWRNPDYGGGDGEAYASFLVETLKPYIDQHYRTLPDRNNTAIGGSSLGGLISCYAALQYQQVFSKAAVFSPSYWYSDSVWAFAHNHPKTAEMKIYQLCGTLEGAGTVEDMMRMSDTLTASGFGETDLHNKIVAGGQHNEALWRSNFEDAFLWLFGGGAQSAGSMEDKPVVLFFPNPVKEKLSFAGLELIAGDTLSLFSADGRLVKQVQNFTTNEVDVSDLKPGIYLFVLKSRNVLFEGKFIRE